MEIPIFVQQAQLDGRPTVRAHLLANRGTKAWVKVLEDCVLSGIGWVPSGTVCAIDRARVAEASRPRHVGGRLHLVCPSCCSQVKLVVPGGPSWFCRKNCGWTTVAEFPGNDKLVTDPTTPTC